MSVLKFLREFTKNPRRKFYKKKKKREEQLNVEQVLRERISQLEDEMAVSLKEREKMKILEEQAEKLSLEKSKATSDRQFYFVFSISETLFSCSRLTVHVVTMAIETKFYFSIGYFLFHPSPSTFDFFQRNIRVFHHHFLNYGLTQIRIPIKGKLIK